MSEEKKEKFTFSDKIKSSKNAASKSDAKPAGFKLFAKSSSKIGKDGKPRQTLLERTRRDAPFFIAALVALLLLPFLYKYSGQSSEEELMAPVSEENIFNPDHVGFNRPFTEDPDGQIAQFSGRDSLTLVRGYGSGQQDYKRDDMDFDASSTTASDYDYTADSESDSKRAAVHHESSDMDIENNTTNIYKRRAKKATRAAFRRPPTVIGHINPASMRRANAGGLNVKNWGGSIKNAAQKVKSTGPTEAPKPVSLQPLRAKSGRSVFGGTAKAGRASRDALGKADARAALRDANVKPVDPTRVGGLDLFSMGGPGGGKGSLERKINIAPGKEPWWWDMMKTRMQKEWEKRFERKWKWIDWADQIAMNILKGLVNCILTGDDGGDVAHFLGDWGTSGGKKECCGWNEKKWNNNGELGRKGIPFDEDNCKANMYVIAAAKGITVDKCAPWKDTTHSGNAQGIIKSRLCCMGFCGAGFNGSAAGSIEEGHGLPCADVSNHRYHLSTYELPKKWQQHTYIYVVARNYQPINYPPLDGRAERGFLCAKDGILKIGAEAAAGADNVQLAALRESGDEPNNFYKSHKSSRSTTKEQGIIADMYDLKPEDVHDGCVIYIQRGNTFNYDNFQANMVQTFKKVLKKSGVADKDLEKKARDSFNNLDLMFIEGFASQHKLAYAKWFETGNNLHEILPLVYWRFYDAFVEHRGTTNKATGSRVNVDKRKQRVWGTDSAMGDRCYFEDSISLECVEEEKPQVIVHFNPQKYKGGGVLETVDDVEDAARDIVVSAKFVPLNADSKFVGTEQPLDTKAPIFTMQGKGLIYTFTDMVNKDKTGKEKLEGKIGRIVWSVDRKGNSDTQHMLTISCPFNMSGDMSTPPVQEQQCKNAQESEECCLKINGSKDYEWDASKPKGSQCVEKKKDECPQKENTNAKCCKDLKGANHQYDENHSPKCYLPSDKPETRLAPVISWVPSTGKTACREDADKDTNPTESTFAKCSKIPGVVQGQAQKCGSQQPMVMDSNAAAKFVKDVVAAYNKNLPQGEKQLSDKFANGKFPTDGEFIDALYLAKGLGIQKVPASAVCELGRDMVRMSRDKHTKEMTVAKPLSTPYASEQWKESNTVFHNELGAFLAYIHVESLFYPQKYYGSTEQCDYRFQVLGEGCPNMVNWANESCLYNGKEKCKEYHHNNYNNIPSAGAQAVTRYPESLRPIQVKSKYPLKGLASGDYPLVGNSDGSRKGRRYIERISPLLRESSGFTAWEGNACVAGTSGTADLQVEDVLKYVETACSVGLDFKPYGTPGSKSGNKPAPGQSGSDTGTQGN